MEDFANWDWQSFFAGNTAAFLFVFILLHFFGWDGKK
jgi:hypothetical protein